MSATRYSDIGPAGYFGRPPEKLVLEGYRCWTRGFAMRSTEPWTDAQLLYRRLLGSHDGAQAIVALSGFVKTLGLCAACPLRTFRSGSQFICRDEVLVMGLIAGIQNCDEPTMVLCLERLCCPRLCDEVAATAGIFALTLKAMGKVMMPIPLQVVTRIADGAGDAAGSRTVH